MGAAQQPWLLYRNHPEISDLQNLQRCRAPEVPICELVENKERRLKEKTGARRTSAHLAIPTNAKNFPSALAAVKGQARWRGSLRSPLTAALASGMCPP
jgi:hypothetical protein